jgi:hypothetical protein
MSVADDIAQRWAIFAQSMTIVNEKFEDGRTYATSALSQATQIMNDIKTIALELNVIDIDATLGTVTPPVISDFTDTKPTKPDTTTNFPSSPTTSELEDLIQSKLITLVQGESQGIPENIQDAIIAKDSERDALILEDTLDKINDEWSKRGFSLPNAMLVANLQQAITEHGNKRTDKSRDILIKNFEMSDANIKFAIQQGTAFILQRIQIYQAEITAEAARIDAIVKTYLGELQGYQTSAQVHSVLADIDIRSFEAELKYELARADLLIKNAEIDIKNYEVIKQLRLAAMDSIGKINSQIVAGALSSVSAAAQISASNSGQYQYSASDIEVAQIKAG